MKSGAAEAIVKAGGALYAVTSEPQTLASEAQQAWELSFPSVGDPHHEIAKACRERGWLSLFVNRDASPLAEETGFAAHPNGYFQPGVLALSSSGRVLYRWRGRPTHSNQGGATERPVPADVWEKIQRALDEPADAPDAEHDEPERFDTNGAPWPIFASLLVANGNFLRPRPFPNTRGDPNDAGDRIQRAFLKLAAFSAAWAVAFLAFNTWIVAGGLVAWAAYIAPSVREIGRKFQHVPVGEPD